MDNLLRIGIVGAGLMGHRRAQAIQAVGGGKLIAVADIDVKKAVDLAKIYQAEAVKTWQELVGRNDLDAVIIAVPNKFLAPIAISALKRKKHILCEKPFGRNPGESERIIKAAKNSGRLAKVGFNHRFHAAILKAKEIFDRGEIGKILFIRARYGHGGRLGMEKEWRFQKEISGGGELLDQGNHTIDLCRYFGGDFKEVYGLAQTKFWKTKVDDNAFALMKNHKITAIFHVSTTNWKNIFSFEIFGDRGFLEINGKGGSYGKEILVFGKRRPEIGIPEITTFEYPRDISWEEEWKNFLAAIRGKIKLIGDMHDGLKANRIVEAIYKSSRIGKPVKI